MAEALTIEDQRFLRLREEQREIDEEEEKNRALEEEYGLEEGDLEELQFTAPKKATFPLIIFGCAILKDAIDIIGEFVSFGILGSIATIILWLILFLWMFGKGMMVKKYLLRRLIFPALLAILAGIIPGLNAVPEATVFILVCYYQEKKVVKKFFQILEAAAKL